MTQRTILFRGKRLDNNEWVYGGYFKHDTVKTCFSTDDPHTKHFIIQDGFCDWGFEPNLEWFEVDPKTVGQFIGLRDIDNVHIFEGDIVQFYRNENYRGTVEYGEFNCSCCDGVYGWSFGGEDIRNYGSYRVVGNIHDNPEFLEETK